MDSINNDVTHLETFVFKEKITNRLKDFIGWTDKQKNTHEVKKKVNKKQIRKRKILKKNHKKNEKQRDKEILDHFVRLETIAES